MVAVLAAGALLAACSGGHAQSQADGKGGGIGGAQQAPTGVPRPLDVELSTSDPRQSGGVVAAGAFDAVYNYGPTVMRDGGKLRMWWCSQYGSAQPAGDDILYAQSPSLDGPFSGSAGGPPAAVFSGAPGGFDGVHTCDPSVIKVGSTYYMYYTGAAGDHAHGNSIGLATSPDGINWKRAAGGQPIVGPAHDVHRANNVYGAGQPSAVYLDGWFYLLFTDTTAKAAGWNGAGQFLLRSKDAAFGRDVETLGEKGFVPKPSTISPRTRSLVDAFSTDLMWVGALDAFVIAHETDTGTTLTYWTRDFTAQPYKPLVIPGAWKEGPGLVRRPDGHAPLTSGDVCDRVPFDVFRATVVGGAGAPTDLKHFGLDVRGSRACDGDDRVRTAFEGVAMPSPQRTIDLVADGKLVRIDRRSVAAVLAGEVVDERLKVVDRFPLAGRLSAEARMVRAPGRGVGVVLDGKLFVLPDAGAAALNDSRVEDVTDQVWDGYPAGFPLAG